MPARAARAARAARMNARVGAMNDTTQTDAGEGNATQHADALLDILRCPLTKSRLRREGDELVAEVGGLRYPTRQGIPQMLIEEARLPEGVSSLDDLKARLREQGQLPG